MKEVIYKDNLNKVRVTRVFDDRAAKYCYYLEKYIEPFLFMRGYWSNGSIAKCRIPPVCTYNTPCVKAWANHYHLEKV
jgi:hypothetical protein